MVGTDVGDLLLLGVGGVGAYFGDWCATPADGNSADSPAVEGVGG